MARRVQLRRGSTAQHEAFTGAEGEVTVDTTTGRMRVHNGSTPGGAPLSSFFHVAWFGARPGASESVNSAAIQAALDACDEETEGNGGRVKFDLGSYEYDEGLVTYRGIWLIGEGQAVTELVYSGSGIAIDANWTGDVNIRWHGGIQGLKLTTTTDSPSVGPGETGIRLRNVISFRLDDVEVRGFDVQGVLFATSSGNACLNIIFENGTFIHENTRGVVHDGVNDACNAVTFADCYVSANIEWNVYNGFSSRGWRFDNAVLENGGTGGSHGSLFLRKPYGLKIGGGSYFEQLTGTGDVCIEFADIADALGISITASHFQGHAGAKAIHCGTSANVRGINISGNFFSTFDVGIDANGIVGGRLGPNHYTGVTTPVAYSSFTTAMVDEQAEFRLVRMPLALWDGMTAPSTLSGFAQIYVDGADGDLKVKFGDGTVKTLATDT